MPSIEQFSFHRADANSRPLSMTISSGQSLRMTIQRLKKWAKSVVPNFLGTAKNYAILKLRSTTPKILSALDSLADGSPAMRSIVTGCHGRVGTCKGRKGPIGFCLLGLLSWQEPNLVISRLTSFGSFGRAK